MALQRKRCAFVYDFDLTLSEEYQELPFLHEYAQGIQDKYSLTADRYLPEVCGSNIEDVGVGTLQQFVLDAQDIFPGLNQEAMKNHFGPQIKLAPGLPAWFPRINYYAQKLGLEVSHHIISAGIVSLIEGTALAQHITPPIYAGEFLESENKIHRVKRSIDPYNKTKWIKAICKGKKLDANLTLGEYHVNYDHVILFADGFTDRDAINFIRERGGYTLGVYKENDQDDFEKARAVLEHRVHFLVPRNYCPNSPLEDTVLRAITRVSSLACNYNFMLIDGLPLGHISHTELSDLTVRHLQQCYDCQYRCKPTEIYSPHF